MIVGGFCGGEGKEVATGHPCLDHVLLDRIFEGDVSSKQDRLLKPCKVECFANAVKGDHLVVTCRCHAQNGGEGVTRHHEVCMDLIGGEIDIIFFQKGEQIGELLRGKTAPDRIVRVAKKHQFCAVLACFFDAFKIHRVAIVFIAKKRTFRQRATIDFHRTCKRAIDRGLNDDGIGGFCQSANHATKPCNHAGDEQLLLFGQV